MKKPLDPQRERYIRDYANTAAAVPATHVSELIHEIERLREELVAARTTSFKDMSDKISSGAVRFDEAAARRIMQRNGPLAIIAYAQMMIVNYLRQQAQPPT